MPNEQTALDRAMRELTGEEAAALGCRMYLQFSEGIGSTAYDTSGNTNDGTLLGTTDWVGFEGGPDLAGVRKPRVWGVKRRRSGKLVDPQRLVYQANDGPTEEIVVTENGAETLTNAGDFDDVYDWTPTAGHYATQLSRGLVRFYETPQRPAFDVLGIAGDAYSAVAAEIASALAVAGGIDEASLDLVAVGAVAAARPGAVGIATGDSPVTVASLLDSLLASVDGWWTITRDGRLTMGLREDPTEVTPVAVLTDADVVENGIRRAGRSIPVYQIASRFREFEATLQPEEVSGSVPEKDRHDLGRKDRRVLSHVVEATRDRAKDSVLGEVETLYDLRDDCTVDTARRLLLDRRRWIAYQFPLAGASGLFKFRIGDVVETRIDRLWFAGWRAVVAGIDEDPATRRETLVLLGRAPAW